MKIRSGFVSNSSSSSFTCSCCGETQSGWDLCLSDAGMTQCENGHYFCDDHAIEATVTDDDKRAALIAARENYRNASWKKPGEVDEEIAAIRALNAEELEDEYNDYAADSGCSPACCPICQMEESCDSDIRGYALKEFGFKNAKEFASAMKSKFGNYDAFKAYIK